MKTEQDNTVSAIKATLHSVEVDMHSRRPTTELVEEWLYWVDNARLMLEKLGKDCRANERAYRTNRINMAEVA